MNVLFTKRGRALLFPLIIFFLSSNIFANEQVDAVGRIFLDNRTNEFYFFFNENDHDSAYPISIKNRKTFEQLKKLNKKWVRVSGHKEWIKETIIEKPRRILKLEIEQFEEFRLSELKVLTMNNHSGVAEINYRIIDKDRRNSNNTDGGMVISISDEAANSLIAGAGVAIGIAAGPMSLIPAGLFGLKTLLIDD